MRGIAVSERTLYREEANEDNIQPLREGEVQLRGYGDDGPPCNNQIFKCCNELLIARSDNNEHIFMSYRKRSNDNDIFDVARSVSKPS